MSDIKWKDITGAIARLANEMSTQKDADVFRAVADSIDGNGKLTLKCSQCGGNQSHFWRCTRCGESKWIGEAEADIQPPKQLYNDDGISRVCP